MKIKRSNYLQYGYNAPDSEKGIQSKKVKKYDVQKLVQDLTEPFVWRDHIENDLMKFWMKDATELQGGLFPTYLTNEGFRLSADPDQWPEEIRAALENETTKGLITPQYNFVRAHSRLTYAYGIAFHVTGKEKYLEQCKKGVQALIGAIDGNHGMFTMQEKSTGKWGQATAGEDKSGSGIWTDRILYVLFPYP